MRIVTITLNPCIDKSTTIPCLLPEKKLRCTKPVHEPGGGGINVARAIKKLGADAIAIYLSGGYNGNLMAKLMEAEHVTGMPVAIQNDTRENTIILDAASNAQYRFCMPGPEVSEEECKLCLQTLSAVSDVGYIVISGSFPPGVPNNFFALLALYAKAKKIKLIVDIAGNGLKQALTEGVYLVKPNMAELCEYAAVNELTIDAAAAVCRRLIANRSSEIILLSMGEAGALLVTDNITKHIKPPAVVRRSTVGAGDSMTAGMVLSLARGQDAASAAQYAVACGTAATMRPGTQLCSINDVDAIYDKIKAS